MRSLFALLLLLTLPAFGQQRDTLLPRVSANATVSQTVGVTPVTVTYGRPAVRERTLFGPEGEALEAHGNVWRAGANEATTITFGHDVQVEGQPVPAGTYSLFFVPDADAWTVVVNRVAAQWGAFSYDAAQDVARASVEPVRDASHVELLTYTFPDVAEGAATLEMAWGTYRVPVRITVDTRAALTTAGTEATDWRVPNRLATYALGQQDWTDAAALDRWTQQAVALERNYVTLATLARVHARAGRYADAVTVGDEALMLGRALSPAPRDLSAFETEVSGWRER